MMDYSIEQNGIKVPKNDFFNPFDTVLCGQVFRYNIENNKIIIYSKNHRAIIEDLGEFYFISTNVPKYFVKYLDFEQNYDIIYSKLNDKGLIRACLDYSKGIHILNQDPVEMIISFIISANNNIPRIQKIINKLCLELGENCGDYYAFPTIEALASQNEDFYKSIGAGYRASYLADTSKKLLNYDVSKLFTLTTEDLIKELEKFKGVGPKVADCIALFAFHRGDVCPVDTWMKKVYNEFFGDSQDPKFIRKELTDRFKDLSGYMQQYLFYYMRELDN